MLTNEEIAHFKTFGFIFIKRAFSDEEIATVTLAAEKIWSEDAQPARESGNRYLKYFVERDPVLTARLLDDRNLKRIEAFLGPDFIWVGSEGNVSVTERTEWHPDRKHYCKGEEHWIDYPRLKIMIYLEEVKADTGCLRVIPGSHKSPFHKDLGAQESAPGTEPFGVPGDKLPAYPVESGINCLFPYEVNSYLLHFSDLSIAEQG